MKPYLIVDNPSRWPLPIPGAEIVSAHEYLSDERHARGVGRKVFNLCRSLRYQGTGYYVSLLAEARGHRALPSIEAIQSLKISSVVRLVSQGLDALIQKTLKGVKEESFELGIYFGRSVAARHDPLARALFNALPAPLLRARFERGQRWRLSGMKVLGLFDVPEEHREFLVEQAARYLKRSPARNTAIEARYDLAILHDPASELPPSDPKAMEKFAQAAEAVGFRCEFIGKDAYGRIGEFDALFIRETTSVNHYTYRFARRAEAEGLVVIDDPGSIVRCTNKVFLAETLARHKLPIPKTLVVSRRNARESILALGLPCILKEPDSAFSAGVSRVDSEDELDARLEALFAQTDLLVVQEYVPTDFDWRIGVLDGEPLYACRYGMAPDHWQIIKRDDAGMHEGDSQTLPVSEAPVEVVKLACRAAGLMGRGLYGVDLKIVRGTPVVIEVNDNPSIEAGCEDAVLGDELYRAIMRHFRKRLEDEHSRRRRG